MSISFTGAHPPDRERAIENRSAMGKLRKTKFERLTMARLERDAPFPEEVQGKWTDTEDSTTGLVIEGSEISCFGAAISYDYKIVETEDDVLTVSLMIDDPAGEDAFQRNNITGLALNPDGELHAYNVKFASQFERASH